MNQSLASQGLVATLARNNAPRASAQLQSEPCYAARLLVPFLTVLRNSSRIPSKVVERLAALPSDQRVHVSYVHSLLQLAEQLLDDPALGLRASEAMTAGDAGMFDFLMLSADTPRLAIGAGARYLRLISDAHELTLTIEGARAVARFESRVVFPRAGEDFAIASLIRNHIFNWPEGMLEQTDAWFRHEPPRDLAPYHEALGAVRLHFDAAFSGFTFPARFLDAPLRRSDARLHSVLRAAADETLATLPVSESVTARVRKAIADRLATGDATLPKVAAELKLHPRKLTRSLLREGARFEDLILETRRDTALNLLANTDRAISDIAKQTGFAGKAPFHRAFRRWTGETPGEYRRLRRGR